MRIVSWNCNGAFRRKFDRIASLDADIFVIQECEDPANSHSAYHDWAGSHVWRGGSSSKGIGVFVKNGLSIAPLDWPDHGLQQFLPVAIGDRLNLLAVWTKNSPKMSYIGQFWQYVRHHSDRFDRNSIFCGDFNSNAIWDKRGRAWNHSECVSILREMGFRSLYHQWAEESQGVESRPTFYLQKNLAKPYHLDYIFGHGARFADPSPEVFVGHPADWLSISDHMPVVLTF